MFDVMPDDMRIAPVYAIEPPRAPMHALAPRHARAADADFRHAEGQQCR